MAISSTSLAVLIVDDQKTNQLLMQKLLQSIEGWNLKVECSHDGPDCLSRIRESSYDLIFLDYRLPGPNGLEVLSQIRQTSPTTSVVMITAAGDTHIAVEAMKNGAMDYMTHDDLLKTDLAQIFRRLIEIRGLVNQNMELRQINQMKNEFIANVSHELRTPLAVVLGYAQTLLDGKLGPVTAEQSKALSLILERSQELLITLNRILRIRETMEGRLELLLKPLEFGTFIKKSVDKLPAGFNRKRLSFEWDLPKESCWVLADEARLGEAVANLFSNAVKFSPEGKAIAVSVSIEEGSVTLSVRDEGPGIAPEILPHIFQRFFAAGQGPVREYTGLGLGLALSQQIIKLHDGRIWLESKGSGAGTTAHISLPRSAKDAGEKVTARPAKIAKKKILIVEDNPDLIEILLLYMAGISPNFSVSSVSTGLQALEWIGTEIPDLIILDLMMPEMSGQEVLKRLRRAPETAKIPVLIVTGYGEKHLDAAKFGAQDFLLKPFEKAVFNQKVLRLLNETPD